ncbi:multidrug ABC transporter permease [Furfurilactobacillus rossiae]
MTSTISIFLMQYVVAFANHQTGDTTIWLRSGVFGLWSSATTAAGSITFQRFQGTLKYLVNSRTDERISLAALVMPAASFGLLSFPIAFLMAVLTQTGHSNLSWAIVGNMVGLWCGAVIMDLFISSFFVLTRNALVYEGLVTIPILVLSGLFGTPAIFRPLIAIGQWIIPIAAPVNRLLNNGSNFLWVQFITSSVLWIVLAWRLSGRLIQTYRKQGVL